MRNGLLFGVLLIALAIWNLFAALVFFMGFQVFDHYADGLPLQRALRWLGGTAFSLIASAFCFAALRWRKSSYLAAVFMGIVVTGLIAVAVSNGGNTGIAPPVDMAFGLLAFGLMLVAIILSRPQPDPQDSIEVFR